MRMRTEDGEEDDEEVEDLDEDEVNNEDGNAEDLEMGDKDRDEEKEGDRTPRHLRATMSMVETRTSTPPELMPEKTQLSRNSLHIPGRQLGWFVW